MDEPAALLPHSKRARDGRSLTILYHHRTRSADGQSIHIDGLVGALRAAGHVVHVVGPRRIAATQTPIVGRVLPRFVHELLELGYNIVEFCKLTAAVFRYRPDGLYERANVFLLSGAWIARCFQLPFLLEVNAPLVLERSSFGGMTFRRLAAWSEHYAWRAADCVLPVTGVLARLLESAGVPRFHIKVTPNGIDPERLRTKDRSVAKQDLGLGSDLVLGFVGFVREWHGIENVVDLLSCEPALSNARLLIVGDGPARESILARARASRVDDRITITGVVPHARIAELVSAMDIALQPEVTQYASPLKLFEYMALGRAIVAPDSENISEILENGVDALLFRRGDAESLAETVRILAIDHDLRDRIGAAAISKIARRGLTWEHNADKVVSIMEELSHPATMDVASTRVSHNEP
jgi:glycosyltransferase involved in cell wall biosynthesis